MPFPGDNFYSSEPDIRTLKDFRYLINDINRPYLFQIEMPAIDTDNVKLSAFARSTSIPAYELETVDIRFQTQTIKVANKMGGSQTWSVEFLCDHVYSLRSKFLAWLSQAYEPHRLLTGSPRSYKTNSTKVTQLSRTGQPVQTYQFIGLFPTKLGEVSLGHEETGFTKFTVEFAYDYYTVESGGTLIENVAVLTGNSASRLRFGLTGVNTGFDESSDINTQIGAIGLPEITQVIQPF